jgi:SAM-dependent methyltransferase
MSAPACRLCGAALTRTFVDLGMSPPCESFLTADAVDAGETFYPLHVRICERCLLVQLPAYVAAEQIFDDYAYFSSYSDSWVAHARKFVDTAVERLSLTEASYVVEVASNDGYLLQHVVERGIRCLGIEPAANVAAAARRIAVPTEVEFLGEDTGSRLAAEHGPADLVVANNVLAHVPDIVDFAKGLRALVADDGRVSIEIPHLLRLIQGNEYDTIYHEHFSYLSLLTTQRVLGAAGLVVLDVEELGSHGGSLRTWSAPVEAVAADPALRPTAQVERVLAEGCTRSRDTQDSPTRWRPCATTCSGSCSTLAVPGSASSRTARRARATRSSTTAGSAPTSSSSPSTATRTSTAGTPQARTSRSILLRRSTPLGRTTS